MGMCYRSRSCVAYNYGCFLLLKYGPLIAFLWFSFCIIYYLAYAITHSEFSRDDVSFRHKNECSFFLSLKVMRPPSLQTGVYCATGGTLDIILILYMEMIHG